MFKKYLSVLIVAASASPLLAQAEFDAQQFSGGVKLGMFMVDSAAGEDLEKAGNFSVDIDNGVAFGLHGDYHIQDNWYVDVEYMSSSFDATLSNDVGSGSATIDVSTLAAYAAYRSPEQLYYVGKVGLIHEDVSGEGGFGDSEIGMSFSIGGGYKIQDNFSIEAEFTSIEKDIGFLGLTARYQFQ